MLSLRLSEVPSYLKHTKTYARAVVDRVDTIVVPADCFKLVNQINNMNDFKLYLKMYSYWQFNRTPSAIYDYLTYHKDSLEVQNYLHLQNRFRHLGICFWAECDICFFAKTPHCISWKAAASGLHGLYAYAFNRGWNVNEDSLYLAAENGHLNCLRFGIEKGVSYDEPILASKAARCGKTEILMYLREIGCQIDHSAVEDSARNGHYHSMIYLIEMGVKCDLNVLLKITKDYQCKNYIEKKGRKEPRVPFDFNL